MPHLKHKDALCVLMPMPMLMLVGLILASAGCTRGTVQPASIPKVAYAVETPKVAYAVASDTPAFTPSATVITRMPTPTPTDTRATRKVTPMPNNTITPRPSPIQTTPQIIQRLAGTVVPVDQWNGVIAAFNVATGYVRVTMAGVGAVDAQFGGGLDIGIPTAPKVAIGLRVHVDKDGDDYIVTAINPRRLTNNRLIAPTTSALPTSVALGTPQNFNVQIIGANLVFSWDPVPGAAGYKIFQSDINPPLGTQTLLNLNGITGDVGSLTTLSIPLNVADNANIITVNPGFESGNLVGWVVGSVDTPFIVVSNARADTGSYSAVMNVDSPNNTHDLLTQYYPVVEGNPYTLSVWYYFATMAGNRNFNVQLSFLSSDGAVSATNLVDLAAGPTLVWTNYTTSFTVPVVPGTTMQMRVIFDAHIGVSGSIRAFIDDLSITGSSVVLAPSQFFTVQAYDAVGQRSQFSSWQKPVQSAQPVGAPTSPHLQINNPTASVASSTLSPSVGVAMSPSGFTDTGWNVPLISAANAVAETWVYGAANQFKIVGLDQTGRYGAGTKLRWKQGGAYVYDTVASSAFSTDTTVTTTGSLLTNAAITDNYYSYQATPQGYPAGGGSPLCDSATSTAQFSQASVGTRSVLSVTRVTLGGDVLISLNAPDTLVGGGLARIGYRVDSGTITYIGRTASGTGIHIAGTFRVAGLSAASHVFEMVLNQTGGNVGYINYNAAALVSLVVEG